jgi:hypothetical protein
MSQALQCNTSITTIDLAVCKSNSVAMLSCMRVAALTPQSKHVQSNKLGDQGVMHISQALQQTNSISEISLAVCEAREPRACLPV